MDRRRLAAVALGVAALVAVVGSFAIRPQGASAQSSASVAVDSVDARGESIVVDGSVVGADAASLSFRVGTAPASGATAVGSQVPLDVVAVIDNSANLRNGTVQLAKQAVAHTDLADRLSYAADSWEQQDADAADVLRAVSGVGT